MNEVWKEIIGYEGFYDVSNYGSVRKSDGLIMKSRKEHDGYYRVGLSKKGIRKFHKIARLVAKSFIENPENKPEVNHKNGVKTDDILSNLEWATKSENMKHADRNGLRKMQRGSKCTWSKLDETKVAEIKILLEKSSIKQKEIAKKFGVDASLISQIKSGKKWKYIN